jgi:2-isopropylmalate synthase
MTDYVKIFDTTLRDGEQSPGFALTSPQKVELAHQLAKLGVDVIEAGFPAASPDDFAAVQRIAVAADIDQCWEAIQDAEQPRIHTFLSSSDIHLESQFNLKREQAKARAVEMVARAKSYTPDVEFSPMDATRSDWSYVCEVLEAVIDVGATTVNIADTCGFAQPDEFAMMIAYIREHVANIERATLSVHCHNDLGLAVANSLAAVRAGARQVECCVNGIGERAGNAALEELVMALTVRRDHHRVNHGINLDQLVPISNLLQQFTGILVQPNKAVVGLNAFAHESGIHQDGMLKDARTYEIMSAAAIGAESTRLVLGKHSGRHALRRRLEELGLLLTQDELNHAFAGFKSLADYKKEVTDEDLVRIAQNGRRAADGVFDAIGHVYR